MSINEPGDEYIGTTVYATRTQIYLQMNQMYIPGRWIY